MSRNIYAVLEDSGDVMGPKKVEKPQQKPAPKEVKKTVVGMEDNKTESKAPKKKEPKVVEPKQNQDGFEQVSKTKHTGRPTKDSPKPEKKPQDNKPKGPPTEKRAPVFAKGNGDSQTKEKRQTKRPDDHHTKKEKLKVPIHPRGQRLHDHHDSSKPQKYNSKFVKKSGGGGHNWGKGTEELDVEGDETETKETETTEETKEEPKVEEPPKPLTKEEKKELKKKAKEELKKAKKKKGVAGDKKSDELSRELVLAKVDPNAKTLDEFKREQLEKKKQTLEVISKTISAPVKVETAKSVEETKHETEKKKTLVDELFLEKKKENPKERKDKVKKEKGNKHKPNINDANAFPTLK